MMKFIFTLATALCYLATATSRETSKFIKTAPTITNSLVNLGKMEISLYFNGKNPDDPPKKDSILLPNTMARSHAVEAQCPCSAFKSKDLFPEPSEIINKILRSNDLFKDPVSTHCCDSHEQIEEKTIFFEISPNAPMTINNLKNPLRVPFDKLLKTPPGMFPMRPKAMEIILFPKRKDLASFETSKKVAKPVVSRDDIQVVGDKDVKPLNGGTSVKKDLTLIEMKETLGNEAAKVASVSDTNTL